MKFGFIPIEGANHLSEAIEEVVWGEKLGFDSVFIQERHLVNENFWPTPLIPAAQFIAHTSKIAVGTAVMVLPLYHPARLAEEIAVLDFISKGRFIAGIALGYKSDEFSLYGVDMANRGSRFEEQVHIMKELWEKKSISLDGNFFSVNCGDFKTNFYTKPHPSLWIGGWGPRMIRRAALLGDTWFPGVSPALSQLLERKESFITYRTAAGLPMPKEWPLIRDVVIAKSNGEAMDLARKYLHPFYYKVYAGGWKHKFITEEVAIDFESLRKDRFIIGEPEEVVNQVRYFKEKYGTNHMVCRFFFGDMPHEYIMKELQIFAKEVMPNFK